MFKNITSLILLNLSLLTGSGQELQLNKIVPADTTVERYGKFELTIDLSAAYQNPYNYDEVAVAATFTAPDGRTKRVDGFYMEEYHLDIKTGDLTALSNKGCFKVRFAPDQIGQWSYQISGRDSTGMLSSAIGYFECVLSSNKGFIRNTSTNYLHFDDESQYIPIGENIGWPGHDGFISMTKWVSELIEHGGNYFRMWHAHWGLGIEWKAGWGEFEGIRRYQQRHCFLQDYLFDYCADNGVGVMLTLQHHGQVSSRVNPNWMDNPYNALNGGPCENTSDFFTDSLAIHFTKNRLRYILARWAYANSIMAWELFNEVDWTDDFTLHRSLIQDWHLEMAAFLKENDPYDHLVTTSFAHDHLEENLWANPDIDLTQTHYYLNSSNLERALVGGVRRYLMHFEKPTLIGEFGLGASSSLANQDPDGIHFHNNLWAPLFGGSAGTAMSWWWDSYVHARNLYFHLLPVARVAEQVPFYDRHMSPAESYITGAPGDLILTPTVGWGVKGNEEIIIQPNGTTAPAFPQLGIYLYGALFNAQFRSPPAFTVFYPESGTFSVKTNTASGLAPRITIFLNGEEVLNVAAQPQTKYTIPVPEGENYIVVDNRGLDWITISSYIFSNAGTKADPYTLISHDRQLAAGYLLNNRYNHELINETGQPASITGSTLTISGMKEGNYFVKWYNCLTGNLVHSAPVTAAGGQLSVPVPELFWDQAFIIDDQPASVVAVNEIHRSIDFEIFPNPLKVGDSFYIKAPASRLRVATISLLDSTGKLVQQFSSHLTEFKINNTLTPGFYWLRIENEKRAGVKPLVLIN